jgi:(1->4)-alpha-D-glucan 1-alpha-D-glucosylmutase
MHIPASTYRVQLHKDFNFKNLESVLDYIADLGISTIYAAPIVKATPGSMHGYDVVDPHVINPDIGTLDDFRALIGKVKAKNMSWIQDIVPNHMAFHVDNYRLTDVLERGRDSQYADYFDINWNHHSPKLNGKVQVPFLGKAFEQCVADGELKIGFGTNGFTVDYFQTSYPLSVSVWKSLTTDLNISLPEFSGSHSDWKKAKTQWINGIQQNYDLLSRLLSAIDRINICCRVCYQQLIELTMMSNS